MNPGGYHMLLKSWNAVIDHGLRQEFGMKRYRYSIVHAHLHV